MKIDYRYIALIIMMLWMSVTSAGKWKEAPPLLTARGGSAAAYYDQKIYVFGGKSLENKLLSSVEVLDLLSGQWDSLSVAPMQTPRYNARAIVYDNLIYVIGGRDEDKALKSCEILDPVQNKWVAVQDLRREREGLGAAYFNGRIYAIGGQRDDHMVENIEWYNDSSYEWLDAVFDLPYPRAAFFQGVVNDTFYIFGGNYYGLTKTIYKAVPGSSGYEWQTDGELEQGRAYGGSVTIGNDIYLIGGETSQGKTARVDIFNVQSQSFQSFDPLNLPRSGVTAVVAEDSLIYAIGGFEGMYNIPGTKVEFANGRLTGIDDLELPQLPVRTILVKGYPNPFNGRITLEILLPQSGRYSLNIYNINGQKIRQLGSGFLRAGTHRFSWQASGRTSSGLYFLVVRGMNQLQKFKMIYAK